MSIDTQELSPRERYLAAGRAAGCSAEQMANLAACNLVLQPKQLQFAAAARLCDVEGGPTAIAMGGARGPGKSHGMLAVLGDDCTRFPGLKVLLLRKVGGSVREGFEGLLPKTIGRLGRYRSSQGMFRFAHNDSWIRLGHFQNESDVDKYLGLEYDVIATEEATTLSLAKETAIGSCCRSPRGSGWRARRYYSTNPGGVGHAWFKKMFVKPYQDGCETSTRFIPCTVDDNVFASDEYVSYLDRLTGWLKRAWRYGDWDIAIGQYFTNWSRAHHVRSAFTIPTHWRAWLSLDYGFTHYTCVHLFAEDDEGLVHVVGEHAERRWLIERHAGAIRSLCHWHGVEPWRVKAVVAGGDAWQVSHEGGSPADEYEAQGIVLTRANMARVMGATEILRRLGDVECTPPVAPSVVISEACPRLIECLPSMQHDEHRPEDVDKVDCDANGDGGDDPYDSFRYGIMYAAKGVPSWGESPLGDWRG